MPTSNLARLKKQSKFQAFRLDLIRFAEQLSLR